MRRIGPPVVKLLDDDVESIKYSLASHLLYSVGKEPINATARDWFMAAAYAVRDRVTERWMPTLNRYYEQDQKRVYYMSMEFLIGRTLTNAMISLGIYDQVKEAIGQLGLDFDEVVGWEVEAALGNGGLGRLAACLLDSMAALNIAGFGYGIRYDYGMFTQHVEHGWQVESPENWLRYGNPWEFARPGVIYPVRFGGRVIHYKDVMGHTRAQWMDAEEVMAMAYDVPIPGHGGRTVNNLRLWSAKSTREFDLKYFNAGNYIEAVRDKNESETLSKVLYPSDMTERGKELRFKQEYFFVAASIQDILARFRKSHDNWDMLPERVAIQLNDTHPAMVVAELQRVLVDEHQLDWHRAWSLTRRCCAYTNHTLMSEALETWPVDLFGRILPRHLEIVYQINHEFLQEVRHRHPGDSELLRRVSVVAEGDERRIRMAHLAVVGSHKVNGVAAIHTGLMKSTIFSDFDHLSPGKITNKTNGVTPRRWLLGANPSLAKLITGAIGDNWVTHLHELKKLEPFAADKGFRAEFAAVKRANKEHLTDVIGQRLGIDLTADSLFDVQIKRIHEYKRQLLNLLHVISRYNRIRSNPMIDLVPRTIIIGGKAAPGYALAKLIIKLVNDVADVVNNDPLVGDKLKVVFVPNYNVSTAELVMPAAELSEQISTAGTEASGTGNMKMSMNGALTIGTWDGANVEICEEVGEENMFLFGLTAQEVARIRIDGYDPVPAINANECLKKAIELISSGYFSPDQPDRFQGIVDVLTHGDHYLLTADFPLYLAAQERVDQLYRDTDEWNRRAILNVARMGKFSSDRTVAEYAREIWNVKVE
ncbi:glycogen/starch/alpha-glucan phosphorylase [Magnetospirillum moscoviense]|uniref:Alpha-1,4 glucan phosphorylase n=1 Tax=Magnetospirillum moscoviense TaxID=1437059 RepID=A0A178ML95_9PROT|nr:glycogen/starch/alpha-glucan phosphorylase [Magnetospirillum moscoviense]MBF0324648.1 glycogen/starch/alpha-glucan phosphorylase [Alphaproteobacteria bacterium]OAN48888.1 glycogen phosphorylase [Magnetospirillum moscoviense]